MPSIEPPVSAIDGGSGGVDAATARADRTRAPIGASPASGTGIT